jgi:hypothetical protein
MEKKQKYRAEKLFWSGIIIGSLISIIGNLLVASLFEIMSFHHEILKNFYMFVYVTLFMFSLLFIAYILYIIKILIKKMEQ